MQTWVIVLLVAVVVIAALAVAWMLISQKRSDRLRRRFGTEYDRTVSALGRRRAEADLLSRTERVVRLDIRPLSAGDAERFSREWDQTQSMFVDEPRGAVLRAEKLVQSLMRARGYPMADFDQRVADISVDHPRVCENYRAARSIALASERGSVSTEELRRAMVHYRALFEDLLEQRVLSEVAR